MPKEGLVGPTSKVPILEGPSFWYDHDIDLRICVLQYHDMAKQYVTQSGNIPECKQQHGLII